MTSLPAPNQDPGFNINTAMNTFNQRLGELVRSGQMTVAQAQAAQADMRALQLNPAAANRQAATDIAQRHLQVGKYAPAQQPQGGLTLAEQPEIVVTRPMPQGVGPSSPMPVMPTPMPVATDMREVIGSRMPPPGVRGGDTRIFADQPMAYPGGDPNFNESTGVYTPDARGIGGMLSRFAQQFRNAETMPKTRLGIFGGMQPRALTPEEVIGITSAPRPQGLALTNVPSPQSLGMAMRAPVMQPAPQGLTLSNVPMQGMAPQPAAAPQGMAMGGMMRGSTAEDRGPTTTGQRDAAFLRMQGMNAVVAPQGATQDYMAALADQMSNAVGQNRGVAVADYNATPVARGSARQMLASMPVMPQPTPTGMAMGGLMRKYGGMC